MRSAYIQESVIISPLGFDTAQNFKQLQAGNSALRKATLSASLGETVVAQLDDQELNAHFQALGIESFGSRIEKMSLAALLPLVQQRPITANSLLILSTTKGNVQALADQDIQGSFIPAMAKRIADYFAFQQEPLVISNACVSGLMALSVAKRFIQMEQVSDVYIIAVDELTPFVLSGFQSFQALSPENCRPYDQDRQGVNLGEAAVACYVSSVKETDSICIAGDANINDANHISGPSRTGEGLYLSIQKALQEANLKAEDIDYVLAHGTATRYNDDMEAIAFHRAGLANCPTTSLKGYYGHTLGAAGLLEAVITAECLRRQLVLASLGYAHPGTTEPMHIQQETLTKEIKAALKTASGFAGTNTALILTTD